MSWEIVERRRNATLWQGKDPEGRRIYTVTRDRDGVASEPSSGSHRSKLAAWGDWRARRDAASAMGSARSARKAEAVRENGKLGGRPKNIRCGLNHSGNDRLAKATKDHYQCIGCGNFYHVSQVEAARGRSALKGSGQLRDITA